MKTIFACLLLIFISTGCEIKKMDITPVRTTSPLDVADSHSYRICVSPKGESVAVATLLGVYIFDVATGKKLSFLPAKYTADHLAWSSDGKLVAVGVGNEASVWEVQSEKQIASHALERTRYYGGLRFCPDNKSLLLVEATGGRILNLDTSNSVLTSSLPLRDSKVVPPGIFSTTANAFAVIDDRYYIRSVRPGLLINDLEKHAEHFVKIEDGNGIEYLAVSQNSRYLAIGYNVTSLIYDRTTWEKISTCHFDEVKELGRPSMGNMIFTRDHKYLLASGTTGNDRPSFVGIFQVDTGKLLGQFQVNPDRPTMLGLTIDDKTLVTASRNGVQFWDFQALIKKFQDK